MTGNPIAENRPHADLLTREQAASLVGVSLSKIYYLGLSGKLVPKKIGARVRYLRHDVLAYIESVKPKSL